MTSWCDYYNSQSTLCINETYPSTYWLDICKPREVKCLQTDSSGNIEQPSVATRERSSLECMSKAKIEGYCYIHNDARNIQSLINQQRIRYEEKIRDTREIRKVIKKKRCSQVLKNKRHCRKNAKYGKYCHVHKTDPVYL